MAPLVRRTWSPRGQTPALVQEGGRATRSRSRLPSGCRPGGIVWACSPAPWSTTTSTTGFRRVPGGVAQELTGRVVVVWDGGSMHKGDPIRQLEEVLADRLTLEKFPPYAPMLCPVEPVWSWLKYSQLCNYAPHDAIELNGRVVAELTAIQDDQELLRSFFHASDLPLPLTLLS